MIGQPAVDDTSQPCHQGRRGSPLWEGYIYSNTKGVFLCILSFAAQQKKV